MIRRRSLDLRQQGAPTTPSTRRRLLWFLLRRLAILPLSLFVVVTASFFLVQLIPGDPALVIAGSFATEAEVAGIRHRLGEDRPLPDRYGTYIARLAHGDLGTSFITGQPVSSQIARYLPASIELVTLAMVFAAAVGVLVGVTAGYFRRRLIDRAARVFITSLQSTPDFLVGLLLIYLFFYVLRLAPAPVGRLGVTDPRPLVRTNFLFVDIALSGNWPLLATAFKHAILPITTLGLVYAAFMAKVARATVGRAMWSHQTQFARACGLAEWKVLWYAFLTARTPVLTYGASLFGVLVGGASIVELLFSWGGFGEWGLRSILTLDIPAIQGFVVVMGLITILVYLILDLLVVALDPRISYE